MNKKNKLPIIAISLTGFLLSLQLGFTTFIDSTYLAFLLKNYTSTPDDIVGYIFALTAFIALIVFIYIPKILRRFGNTRVTVFMGILTPVFLYVLSLEPNIFIAIISYLLVTLGSVVVFTANDIYLASYAKESDMGFVRGTYFAIISLGFMISPSIAGYIVEHSTLSYAYLAGAICTIPVSLITWIIFKKYRDQTYEDVPLIPSRAIIKSSAGLMPIFWAHFVLQSFYAVMTVYAPLYFVETIGLGHDEFGYILTIALFMFVILPTPLGFIADKFIGEKEMIVTGIVLMGLSLIMIPIFGMHPHSLAFWAVILIISRIGATMTEIMTDTYFFKKIEHAHPSFVAFYRRSRPLAFLVVPAISAILLSTKLLDIPELFIVFGVMITLSIIFPLKLVDTK